MAGEPLDIQRLEVSCAAARHGLPTAPAPRGPGDAREVRAHCLEGCLRASTWNLYATDEANSSGREECLAIGDTWV
jgi:hypothetical protein